MDKQKGKRKQRSIDGQLVRMIIIVFRLVLVFLVILDILFFIYIIKGDTEFDVATAAYLIFTLLTLCLILFLKGLVKDTEKNQHVSSKFDTTNISQNQYDFRKQDGQRIDHFDEDSLREKYRLKQINVLTNAERENIISISGYLCDDVD